MILEKKILEQPPSKADSKVDRIVSVPPLPRQKDKEAIAQRIRNQLKKATKDYRGGFIPRKEAPKLIGNLYSVGYLANCDSLGVGVENSFRIGRQRCYFIDAFGDWVISKIEEG